MFYYLNIKNLVLTDKFTSGTFNTITAIVMFISTYDFKNFSIFPTYSMFIFLLSSLIFDRVGNF